MLSTEQFSALKDCLCAELAKTVEIAVEKAMSPYRDRAMAAARLSISEAKIDQLKRQGKLKPFYLGTKPLYDVKQLDQIPKRNKA